MAAEGRLCGFMFLEGEMVLCTLGAPDPWAEGRWGFNVGLGQAPPPQQAPPFMYTQEARNVEIWSFLLLGKTTRDLIPGCFLYSPSRRLTSDGKTEADHI